MKTDIWTAMLGLFVVGLMGGLAPAEVVSFQQGVDNEFVDDPENGYQGTDDSTVHSGNRADQNAGTYHVGPVGLSPWGGHVSRGLLRFDLSAMAGQYSDINSVSLKLYSDSKKVSPQTFSLYAIKPANADWLEGTVQWAAETGSSCWNYKAYDEAEPTAWAGSEGLGTPDVDYYATALGTFGTTEGGLVEAGLGGIAGLTLKDLIDQWSGSQANNAGLLVLNNEETTVFQMFASSEALFGVPPELIIDYVAGGAGVGDADGDGFVDDDDLSLLLANWHQDVGWNKGNFNGDNIVDDDDLSLLLSNWTGSGAVPEPASALLVLLGASVLARRRRH